MVYAMDTLGYAKRLRDAGIPQQHAEAHAEAARDFIMAELVTKTDLQTNLQVLRTDLQADIQTFKGELQAVEARLESKIIALEGKVDALTPRMMVFLGGLLAGGIA